jgi:hypothetical protein
MKKPSKGFLWTLLVLFLIVALSFAIVECARHISVN